MAWCSVEANNAMRLCISEKAVGRRPVVIDGREEAANLAANMIPSTSSGVDTSVEDTTKCLSSGFDPLGEEDPFGNYVSFTIWAEKKHFDTWMGGKAFKEAHGGTSLFAFVLTMAGLAMVLKGASRPAFYNKLLDHIAHGMLCGVRPVLCPARQRNAVQIAVEEPRIH